MEILATALPGFRHLRAPLIAGYLWLVFLWILIKPDIHKRPTNGVAAAVYDLAKDAGPIWVGLGVGVAVYLVGTVSQALSPMLGHKAVSALWPGLLRRIANMLGHIANTPGRINKMLGDEALALRRRLLRIIADETDPIYPYEDEARRKLDLFRIPRRYVNPEVRRVSGPCFGSTPNSRRPTGRCSSSS